MNRIRYVMATFAGAAALALTFMGATTAQAAETTSGSAASSVADVQPFTNPPGACTRDELGDWKVDKFGIIHYCTYIDGGYYWIPL